MLRKTVTRNGRSKGGKELEGESAKKSGRFTPNSGSLSCYEQGKEKQKRKKQPDLGRPEFVVVAQGGEEKRKGRLRETMLETLSKLREVFHLEQVC